MPREHRLTVYIENSMTWAFCMAAMTCTYVNPPGCGPIEHLNICMNMFLIRVPRDNDKSDKHCIFCRKLPEVGLGTTSTAFCSLLQHSLQFQLLNDVIGLSLLSWSG